MPNQPITPGDIDALLRFLPLFDVPGRSFAHWPEPAKPRGGAIAFPYPKYPDDVREFYRLAGSGCWQDFGYSPQKSSAMLADPERVRNATLLEVRSMLTFCVRSERFGDGSWEHWLRKGYVVALLKRLQALRETFERDPQAPEN
jgi:hypothetical protein